MEHENTTARVISPDKPDKSPGPKHAGKYNYYDMRDALERAAGRISLLLRRISSAARRPCAIT